METLGNLKRKRGQSKSRRRSKRGRPFYRRTVTLVLGLAPLLTALVDPGDRDRQALRVLDCHPA